MDYDPDEAYLVVTDASNYKDCGAWASLVRAPGDTVPTVMCGSTHHPKDTTYREELLAVIEALFYIHATHPPDGGEIVVYCMGDNKSVVQQINGEANIETNQDLWARYDYLAGNMYIHAQHIPRETNKMHDEMDLLASSLRLCIRDFVDDTNVLAIQVRTSKYRH